MSCVSAIDCVLCVEAFDPERPLQRSGANGGKRYVPVVKGWDKV